MKASTLIERKIKNMKIAVKCQNNCLCCNKYNSVKEMDKNCEYRKARGRLINRQLREAKKKKENIPG